MFFINDNELILKQKIFQLLKKIKSDIDLSKINIQNFIEALTHSSYKGIDPNSRDYERFEFLGDSVLNFIVADKIFHESGDNAEKMTEKRKQLINNKYLSLIFDYLELESIIIVPPNFKLSEKIKGDFIEALFGALYINLSIPELKKIWENLQLKKNQDKIFEEETSKIIQELKLKPKNPISVVQEFTDKLKDEKPEYELILKSGTDHEPIYRIRLTLKIKDQNGEIKTIITEGIGNNLKKARFEAAKAMCLKLKLPYEEV